jgi:SNF2 family DNA or RNA helicase
MIFAAGFRPEFVQPFPFQIVAAEWMASKTFCVLGDGMRVGKTPSAIRACDMLGLEKILVICPANLRINWLREFQRFSPMDRVTQAVMPNEIPRISGVGVTIVSYEGAVKHKEILQSVGFQTLICDEVHFLKSRTSRRAKTVYGCGRRSAGIASTCKRFWGLSGTIAPNNASELWVHLHAAGLADESYWDFTLKYTTGWESAYGYVCTGSKNVEELKQRLSGFVLRRTLQDVMPQLPPVTFETVTVPRSDAFLSPEFRDQFPQLIQADAELQAALSSMGQASQVSMLEKTASSVTTLRRFILASKLPAIGDQLEEDLSTGGIDKIVVFCVFKIGVDYMAKRLEKFGVVTLNGDTPSKQRQENIDSFRTSPNVRVFVGNLVAAGVGIDLAHCSECVLLECSFVPGDNQQAVARLQGVNQKNSVRVRVFSLFNSVDERISEVLVRKTRELSKIL